MANQNPHIDIMKFLEKLPFTKHPWFAYLSYLVRHFIEYDCPQKSASLTYTTLLSLVPIITVMLVVFSVVPAMADVREHLQELIYRNILPTSGEAIRTHLEGFAQKSSNLGIIGVAGVFVTTIMTLITIETAFNKIWRVQETTSFLTGFLRYWTMITLAPIVLGVAFGASSAISGLSFLNQQFMGYGIDWAIWAQIVSFVIMTAGFVGMYWFVPKTQVPIKHAVIAGVVVAVLFETLKTVFGTVIANFTSYEAIYGAFAVIPVFLMWIYLSWNVILLGVEISYTLTIFDGKDVAVRHAMLSLLDMLNLVYKNYQTGKTTSQAELRAVLGRKELPKWSIYISELVSRELITPTKDNEYVLRTDLDTISLWEFYKSLPYPLPIKDELDKLKKTDYDPWFEKLSDELIGIENRVKDELSMSLGSLFNTTPLLQKEPIAYISDDNPDEVSDKDGFRDNAKRLVGDKGEHIIIPTGDGVPKSAKYQPKAGSLGRIYERFFKK